MSKVIDINIKKKQETTEKLLQKINDQAAEIKTQAQLTFEELARINRENEERLKRERLKSNKQVLRDYRIK